jgi:hypothetical protein
MHRGGPAALTTVAAAIENVLLHSVLSRTVTSMQTNTDRILTTHTGVLPRPDDVVDLPR